MTEKPMSLTSNDVKRVAKLARLGLTEAETTEILTRLNSIIGLVDQMVNHVNKAGIPLLQIGGKQTQNDIVLW